MTRKILSVLLCLSLASILFTGCSEAPGDKVSFSAESSGNSSGAVSPASAGESVSDEAVENTGAALSSDEAPEAAGNAASGNTSGSTVTDVSWKNPHAHRKPSSGVPHTEEDLQKHLTIYCLNEGKADAFVMFAGTNNAIVIDCGRAKDGDDILELLEEHEIHHVSALILSHFDKDHIGGADEVINGTDVEKIYTTRGSKDSKQYKELVEAMELNNKTPVVVREYTSFEVDGTTYEIIPPLKDSYLDDDNEANNSSLIVKVTNADNTMLFTGDIENERFEEILATDYKYDLTCDILKMPHHGFIEKLTEQFVKKVTPQYAIIPCSAKNTADPEVLKILKDFEVETYLTQNGEILIDTFPGEITIDQYDD